MNRAQVGGIELEYEVRGTGEPVVLVHGAHIADGFAPLLGEPALTDHYQLILYHRRGFSGSTRPDGPVTMAQHAEDCRGLMLHLGVPSAHIVGHSYGAAIGLQLALDAPDAVHSLALLEPTLFSVPSAPQLMDQLAPAIQLYEAGNKKEAVDAFLQAVIGPNYRDVLDRVLPGSFTQAAADADTFFQIELPELQRWSFTQADAARVPQPVLSVLGGQSDTLWPGWVEVHALVQAWFPRADGYVLQGATHGLQMINPKGMATGLGGFFARHPLPEGTVSAQV